MVISTGNPKHNEPPYYLGMLILENNGTEHNVIAARGPQIEDYVKGQLYISQLLDNVDNSQDIDIAKAMKALSNGIRDVNNMAIARVSINDDRVCSVEYYNEQKNNKTENKSNPDFSDFDR